MGCTQMCTVHSLYYISGISDLNWGFKGLTYTCISCSTDNGKILTVSYKNDYKQNGEKSRINEKTHTHTNTCIYPHTLKHTHFRILMHSLAPNFKCHN